MSGTKGNPYMTNFEIEMRAWQIVIGNFLNALPFIFLLVCIALLLGAMSMGKRGSHGRGGHRGKQQISPYRRPE